MQIYLPLWHVLHTVENQTQENTAEVLLWVIGDLAGWNVHSLIDIYFMLFV